MQLGLKTAIERSGIPIKDLARRANYSPDAIYAAGRGDRRVPQEAKHVLSKASVTIGIEIAHMETGYSGLFRYTEGDRHPQTMLRRVEKEDHEADEAMRGLGWRTIGKNHADDLTEEDRVALRTAGKELIDRVKADLDLVIEWEERYRLGLMDYLIDGKEKTRERLAADSRAYRTQS